VKKERGNKIEKKKDDLEPLQGHVIQGAVKCERPHSNLKTMQEQKIINCGTVRSIEWLLVFCQVLLNLYSTVQ
jgi:hypothetical protein